MEGIAIFRITAEFVSLLDSRKEFGRTDLVQIEAAPAGAG